MRNLIVLGASFLLMSSYEAKRKKQLESNILYGCDVKRDSGEMTGQGLQWSACDWLSEVSVKKASKLAECKSLQSKAFLFLVLGSVEQPCGINFLSFLLTFACNLGFLVAFCLQLTEIIKKMQQAVEVKDGLFSCFRNLLTGQWHIIGGEKMLELSLTNLDPLHNKAVFCVTIQDTINTSR